MKRLFFCFWLLIFQLAQAEEKSVTLHLPSMNCAMCPITVKKALMSVDGIIEAKVTYDDKNAKILFDDSKTNTNALINATTEAGYPSTEVGKEKGL